MKRLCVSIALATSALFFEIITPVHAELKNHARADIDDAALAPVARKIIIKPKKNVRGREVLEFEVN